MIKWDIELAKAFKKRDNKSYIGAIVGTLISTAPVSISILDGNAILQEKHLYISETVSSKIELETATAGSNVLLIPNATENKWFIIDTITKL